MGLLASIYKSANRDCSNGGLSSKHDKVVIVNADGPFEPSDDAPAVMIVKGYVHCSIIAVPARLNEGQWEPDRANMYGGCIVSTSDSRFGECLAREMRAVWPSWIVDFPGTVMCGVKLHDRYEG